MKLLKLTLKISGYTVLSRLGGFFREMLAAIYLGAGPGADSLALALRLPAFFRSLCAEGAVSAAFVPVFVRLWNKCPIEATLFFRHITTLLFVFLIVLTLGVEIFLPFFVDLFFPGLAHTIERLDLCIALSHITFPFIIFISFYALFSGLLNGLGFFSEAASAQAVSNLFIVIFVMISHSWFHCPSVSFAWAFLGSGAVNALWVIVPAWRLGFKIRFVWPRFSSSVRNFFRTLVPVVLSAGVSQINLYIGTVLASALPVGSVSYLHYADRLNQLPLGVIGIAISTVLLPVLTHSLSQGKRDLADQYQILALKFALLFSIPAAVAFVILAELLVSVFLEHGAFSVADTYKTASTLKSYALGLPACMLVKIFSVRFFSMNNTKLPLLASIVSISVDLGLSLVLMGDLKHVGLAVAASVSSWVYAGLLAYFLWQQHALKADIFTGFFLRLVMASAGMGLVLKGFLWWFESFCFESMFQKSLGLALAIIGGGGIFIGLALAFQILNQSDFMKIFHK